AGFQACFRRFWLDLCRSGRPRFELLEPSPWPEHLVALLLTLETIRVGPAQVAAAATAWQQTEAEGKRRFWALAWQEYRYERQGDVDAWRRARLPEIDLDGGAAGVPVGLDGIDIAAALAALRAALAEAGRTRGT